MCVKPLMFYTAAMEPEAMASGAFSLPSSFSPFKLRKGSLGSMATIDCNKGCIYFIGNIF
jgi:hypothetical protein